MHIYTEPLKNINKDMFRGIVIRTACLIVTMYYLPVKPNNYVHTNTHDYISVTFRQPIKL